MNSGHESDSRSTVLDQLIYPHPGKAQGIDVDRAAVLSGSLLVVGLVLMALPIAVPADVPADRVEFYVESDWGDYADQTNLAYANASEDEQAIFDAAREATPATINRTVSAAPESLTPPPDSIELYNVRDDGEIYLLQVRYLTDEADLLTQRLPRVGLLGLGFVCLVGAAYYRFEA